MPSRLAGIEARLAGIEAQLSNIIRLLTEIKDTATVYPNKSALGGPRAGSRISRAREFDSSPTGDWVRETGALDPWPVDPAAQPRQPTGPLVSWRHG